MTVIPNFIADQPTEMSAAWLKRVVGAVCSESVTAEFYIKQGNNREFSGDIRETYLLRRVRLNSLAASPKD